MSTIGVKAQRQYFEKRTFVRDGIKLPYRLELPANYDSTKKYPIILFLHGAGERGSDNESQLTYIDKIFGSEQFRQKYPAFILAPQCPKDKRWVEVDWSLMHHTIPDTMSIPMRLTVALLLSIIHKYNIDTDRIYVTGLSMGGFGTWDIIARFPHLFAAAIPICGGGDEKTAPKIAHIPIWAFHGTLDKVVPVQRSRNMIAAIKKAGGNPKYTEVPNKGHLVWNTAYATPGLWQWLFSQKK
jgi:predicted peptidase